MPTEPFFDLVAALRARDPPKAPSLLVTVFGDLVQDADLRVSASVLGQVLDLLGVRSDSMRVALHRLRKDGWIASQRIGRSSAYFLTEFGRAESAAASPLIYAEAAPMDQAWLVIEDPAGAQPQDAPGAWISTNVRITGHRPDDTDVFVTPLVSGAPLPDWMRQRTCDPALAEMSAALAARLAAAQRALTPGLRPLEVAALRVLIVHGWRRIVLKAPRLPDHVFPDPWQGPACRAAMTDLLLRLPKPAIADLEICAKDRGAG